MPLIAATLQSDLTDLSSSPGETYAECAQAWAAAIGSYASAVVPTSTTVTAAQSALTGLLLAAFQTTNAAPLMESAFTAFALAVGGGMVPAFVAVPPSGPVGFVAKFAGPNPTTHTEAGQSLGSLIDTWMRTGTATPSAGGPPVLWS